MTRHVTDLVVDTAEVHIEAARRIAQRMGTKDGRDMESALMKAVRAIEQLRVNPK